MKSYRYALSIAAAAAALALAACGGGGGSGNGSTTPTATGGTVNVAVTDGPGDEFQHVWVTVSAISFHTNANQVWSKTDSTWETTILPSPVTIDLSTLNNGTLNTLFSNMNLTSGTYRQIRFFFDGAEASLDTSAMQTMDSNGNPLQWNDQVEYLAPGNATAQESPLEIAYPTQGIELLGTFQVTEGGTLSLAVDFDLEHIIVPFNHDGMTYFTMRPNLYYYDMTQVGAISGTIDPASLCSATPANQNPTTCAYNLIVKAELLMPDGSRHYVRRETVVNPVTGNFTLYPLATKDLLGNPIGSYDVLLRGRNMETMLVTAVPVTAGTAPGGSGASAPTVLQSTPIAPVLNTGEYTANFASALAPLSSGYAIFQQTLPGAGAVPYEVRWRNTDPFTGTFRNAIPLQGATSSMHLAPYNGGGALAFAGVTPQEGAGAFTVADNEVAYYTLSAGTVMAPVATGTLQTFAPGAPSLIAGVSSGSLTVNLAFGKMTLDNNCEFVLARFATIVDTYDCASFLSTTGASSGSFPLTGIPSMVPGTYYYAYVRLWETGQGKLTRRIVPLNGLIDLRTQSSTTVNGSIPGA